MLAMIRKTFVKQHESVEEVMAPFQAAIDNLHALAERKEARVEEIEEQIQALDLEQRSAETEANRATAVAEKLQGVLA